MEMSRLRGAFLIDGQGVHDPLHNQQHRDSCQVI